MAVPDRWLLVPIVLIGLGFGAYHVDWGLPGGWHPDEKVVPALRMLREGTANPKYLQGFEHPTLFTYLIAGAVAPSEALLASADSDAVPASTLSVESREARRTWAFRVSRLLSALLISLSSVLVYLCTVELLRERTGVRTARHSGLWAALLTSLNGALAVQGHFAVSEALLIPLLMAGAWLALRALRSTTLWPWYASACVLGLGVSAKYNGAALVVPIALVLLWRAAALPIRTPERERSLGLGAAVLGLILLLTGLLGATLLPAGGVIPNARWTPSVPLEPAIDQLKWMLRAGLIAGGAGLIAIAAGVSLRIGPTLWRQRIAWLAVHAAAGGVVAAGCFVLGTPYAILEHPSFLRDFALQASSGDTFKGVGNQGVSWLAYAPYWVDGLGAGVALVVLLALGWAIVRSVRGDRDLALLVALIAFYYGVIGSIPWREMHYLLPLFPPLFVLAGVGCAMLNQRFRHLTLPIGSAIALVLCALSLVGGVRRAQEFASDSRYLAQRWIAQNIAAGSQVGVFAYPCYLPNLPRSVAVVPWYQMDDVSLRGDAFRAFAERFDRGAPEYLVLSSLYYQRFLDMFDRPEPPFPEKREFFLALLAGRRSYDVVADFEGIDSRVAQYVSPRIVILRRRDAPTTSAAADGP